MSPLNGVKILDLSRVLAGPLATQMLAELGAEVIKVERPGFGDESRHMEPKISREESAYFFAVNRSKKSIAIDMKSSAGRQIILDLVRDSDVVVENFLPGTLDRMGLGYSELKKANPRIILVSNTGFGQTGPEASTKGYDTIFQALSGVMHLTGHPEGGPAKAGVPIADMSSSLWIMIATLVGLLDRYQRGEGSHWDVAMMDIQASLLAITATQLFTHDKDVERTGTEHPGRVPSAAFQCSDGRWVHISASDQHWYSLCRVLEIDEINAKRWETNADRIAERSSIMELLKTKFGQYSHDDIVNKLRSADVPVGLVQTPREALSTPQALHRRSVQSFTHPTAGTFKGISTPLRRSGENAPSMSPPPRLGENTFEVLSNQLGVDRQQIIELEQARVIQALRHTEVS